MIKMYELRELIKLVDQSTIDELELENDGVQITLKKAAAYEDQPISTEEQVTFPQPSFSEAAAAGETAVAAPANPALVTAVVEPERAQSQTEEILSNWVGVFASSVKAGDFIKAGDVVCTCNVDALKLVHEIKSSVSGEVVEILAEDGQLIDYGQPLFLLKAE